MKVERQWILVKPAGNSAMSSVRCFRVERAIELARNMGVSVDRRWTVELDPHERKMLADIMQETDGNSPGCSCQVLRAALLIGLFELTDAIAKEKENGKNTKARPDVDPDRTN